MDLEDRKNDKLLLNLLVPILENEEILKMFHSVWIYMTLVCMTVQMVKM